MLVLRGCFVQLVCDSPWDFSDEGLQAFGDFMTQPPANIKLQDSFQQIKDVCTTRSMLLLDKQLGKTLGPLLGHKTVAKVLKQASMGNALSLSLQGRRDECCVLQCKG